MRRAGLGRSAAPFVQRRPAARRARRTGVHSWPSRQTLEVEPLRQRVDDRDADAVQAAGDLVAAAVAELAAGVQDGQHDLDGRPALLLHHRRRGCRGRCRRP